MSGEDIVQSINFNYDQQNNSLQPISFNDGNMYPARGWQERYSYGVNLKLLIFDINYQPEKLTVENQTQEFYRGNTQDGNFMFKYFAMVGNNIDNFILYIDNLNYFLIFYFILNFIY